MPSTPPLIAPSLLAANASKLAEETSLLENADVDWLHIDVMDGHFVPNIAFGPETLRAIRPYSEKPFDVHLMISPVSSFLPIYADAGADALSFHLEASLHPCRDLQTIRALGKKPGVAINPGTSPALLEPLLDHMDRITVMTVNPGFGGQKFIESALETIKKCAKLIAGRDIHLIADGGVTLENAPRVTEAGASVLVAGATLFNGGSKNLSRNIAALKNAALA